MNITWLSMYIYQREILERNLSAMAAIHALSLLVYAYSMLEANRTKPCLFSGPSKIGCTRRDLVPTGTISFNSESINSSRATHQKCSNISIPYSDRKKQLKNNETINYKFTIPSRLVIIRPMPLQEIIQEQLKFDVTILATYDLTNKSKVLRKKEMILDNTKITQG